MFLLATTFLSLLEFLGSLKWRLMRHFPRLFFYPLMRYPEFRLLEKYARPARTVLEYGSGGSTVYFIRKKKRLYSVESNPVFHRLLTSIPLVARAPEAVLTWVDLGPTDNWGEPLCRHLEDRWPQYHSAIWEKIGNDRPDLVLIDGRFRVACAAYSLLQLGESGKDTLLLIHDFWNRPEYGVLLPFLQTVDRAGTMGVFRKAAHTKGEDLHELVARYGREQL